MTLSIPDDAWSDVYNDEDGLAPRLRTTVTINGTGFYFSAIAVGEMNDGTQETANAEDAADLDRLYELEGQSGPFDTLTIAGREYVVFAVISG